MNTLSDRILNSLPMAILFLVLKIITFPAYCFLRLLGAYCDVQGILGDLWNDWYSKGSK